MLSFFWSLHFPHVIKRIFVSFRTLCATQYLFCLAIIILLSSSISSVLIILLMTTINYIILTLLFDHYSMSREYPHHNICLNLLIYCTISVYTWPVYLCFLPTFTSSSSFLSAFCFFLPSLPYTHSS